METGVGTALRNSPRQHDRHIGVVGLGAGTMAAYGQPGDRIRFYEINPQVTELAKRWFTYLEDCLAKVTIVSGDGRRSLDREKPNGFDFLLLDAFSGDAPPVHLLTREAFAVYVRHLAPDGVILVNCSNWYFDLLPVVFAAADAHGLTAVALSNDDVGWSYPADWAVLGKSLQPRPDQDIPRVLWTDAHASLFDLLLWD